MTPDEHRAICTVPFPPAGPGAVLRFRTIDLLHLAKTFTVDGEPWWQTVSRRVRMPDPKAIQDALAIGLKTADNGPVEHLDWSDLPFPLDAAAEPLLSAIGRALYGRRYIEGMQASGGTAPAGGA